MDSTPFTIPQIFGGLAEAEGVARLDQEFLVLEFRVRDNVFEVIKSTIATVRIPFQEIEMIEFQKGMFSGSLRFRLGNLKLAAEIPKSKATEATLRIANSHAVLAQQMAAAISLRIAEIGLRKLEQSLDRHPPGLPPAP